MCILKFKVNVHNTFWTLQNKVIITRFLHREENLKVHKIPKSFKKYIYVVFCAPKQIEYVHLQIFLLTNIQAIQIVTLSSSCWKMFHSLCEGHDLYFLFILPASWKFLQDADLKLHLCVIFYFV